MVCGYLYLYLLVAWFWHAMSSYLWYVIIYDILRIELLNCWWCSTIQTNEVWRPSFWVSSRRWESCAAVVLAAPKHHIKTSPRTNLTRIEWYPSLPTKQFNSQPFPFRMEWEKHCNKIQAAAQTNYTWGQVRAHQRRCPPRNQCIAPSAEPNPCTKLLVSSGKLAAVSISTSTTMTSRKFITQRCASGFFRTYISYIFWTARGCNSHPASQMMHHEITFFFLHQARPSSANVAVSCGLTSRIFQNFPELEEVVYTCEFNFGPEKLFKVFFFYDSDMISIWFCYGFDMVDFMVLWFFYGWKVLFLTLMILNMVLIWFEGASKKWIWFSYDFVKQS